MKSLRVFVILVLLGLAAPTAIHHRAWSLGISAAQSVEHRIAEAPPPSSTAVETQNREPQPVPPAAQTQPAGSQPPDASPGLPRASSSLPLLSVIGFGVFLGGLISALKTRPAHK